jgi:diguanylate cyclase (GGDEF)-like protein/PAS domain S-box-containing protein
MDVSVDGVTRAGDPRLVVVAAEEIDHAVLISNPDGTVVYANRTFHRMFGYRPGEIIGRPASDLLAREGFDAGIFGRIEVEVTARRTFQEEVPVASRAGETVWMSTVVKPLYDDDGELAHYLLVFSDINDSKQIQRMQRDVLAAIAEDRPIRDVMTLICQRVEAMAGDVVCSILAIDTDQRLRPLASPSLPEEFDAAVDGLRIGPSTGSCGTAAFRNEAVVVEDIATDPLWDDYRSLPLPHGLVACWSTPIQLRDGKVAGTFAFYYRQKRGPSVWHEMIVRACVDLCVVALERHEAKESIARLAYYDSLTGLPNRAKLQQEMLRAFDEAETPQAALLFLDVDHFKDVNDTLGHSIGDRFLVEIAGRLRREVWPVDIISRHGGDEFVIVLVGADAPRAQQVAIRLLEAIAEPVLVDGILLPASASIGVSVCPDDGRDAATLLRNADTAMYSAKADGRGTYRFFSSEMNQMAQDRLLLGALLRDAVANDQIRLHYQPQVEALTGTLTGVEALARWTHPALGAIPPSRFIPLAEDCGLIEAIGENCISQACTQLRRWDETGCNVPRVAVNISPIHFRNPDLPNVVARLLAEHSIAADRLTLEITESVMMDAYSVAVSNAQKLREMGVAISMDDFGTGYSSLSHLAQLPVNEIKIDRSFMANLDDSPTAQALVTAMIGIGESLKLTVVAEGVETVAQRRFVETLGCDVLQGHLFGEAMPPLVFAQWLTGRGAAPQVRGAA